MPLTYMKEKGSRGTAVFSRDKRYRYVLTRGNPRMRRSVWIMLNPSTADGNVNDHTITKCENFSRLLGFDGIFVANLYALISTDPRGLLGAVDPVGPMNDEWLQRGSEYAQKYDVPVIAAWGNNAPIDRAAHVATFFDEMYCLGITDKGQPKHPLRLGYDTPLQRWM